jgi:exo-beta-1,3-glucanase (GH17 family)
MRALRINSVGGLSACVLLSILSSSVFAAPFLGIDYGPYHRDGESPGTPVSDEQFNSDLHILSQKFTYIKTYGDDAQSRLDRVVPIAAAEFPNLKIYQGVFENGAYNSNADTIYLDTAIKLANEYPNVVAVVVGNEDLDTDSNPNPISPTQLIADVQYVRARLTTSKAQVTTGLGFAAAGKYGAQIAPYVDSLMINIYPFYGQVSVDDGEANLISQCVNFNNQFQSFGKPVIVGETGWPSDGSNNGAAAPGVENEQIFTDAVIAGLAKTGSTFLFEGFDEPWLSVQNSWGPHWGLWNSNGSPKFPLTTTQRHGAFR